jgi:hypothetical protein
MCRLLVLVSIRSGTIRFTSVADRQDHQQNLQQRIENLVLEDSTRYAIVVHTMKPAGIGQSLKSLLCLSQPRKR